MQLLSTTYAPKGQSNHPCVAHHKAFLVFASAFLVSFLILGASPENKEARRISSPGTPSSTPYLYYAE